MSVLEHRTAATTTTTATSTTPSATDTATRSTAVRGVLAAIRLSLGWIFLWAFVDKLFGLGFATPSERSWLNGGSPTKGFLSNAATGPFEGLYKSIAGAAWADWLFMIGLAGIGIALVLVALALMGAGRYLGLGSVWERLTIVQRFPFLK